jgi:hypothetical protein
LHGLPIVMPSLNQTAPSDETIWDVKWKPNCAGPLMLIDYIHCKRQQTIGKNYE